jgi:nitrite reductase/ring-hydroxylating ferredoxin subunit
MNEIIKKKLLYKNNTYKFLSKKFEDEIYIYMKDDIYHAISGFCPHFGGPLDYSDGIISCYWHGWKFCPKTYKCTNHDVNIKIKKYIVKDKGTEIIISNDN